VAISNRICHSEGEDEWCHMRINQDGGRQKGTTQRWGERVTNPMTPQTGKRWWHPLLARILEMVQVMSNMANKSFNIEHRTIFWTEWSTASTQSKLPEKMGETPNRASNKTLRSGRAFRQLHTLVGHVDRSNDRLRQWTWRYSKMNARSQVKCSVSNHSFKFL
jgi:hypothetical protein